MRQGKAPAKLDLAAVAAEPAQVRYRLVGRQLIRGQQQFQPALRQFRIGELP